VHDTLAIDRIALVGQRPIKALGELMKDREETSPLNQ
jgi:hypothetical protein